MPLDRVEICSVNKFYVKKEGEKWVDLFHVVVLLVPGKRSGCRMQGYRKKTLVQYMTE